MLDFSTSSAEIYQINLIFSTNIESKIFGYTKYLS